MEVCLLGRETLAGKRGGGFHIFRRRVGGGYCMVGRI